MISALQFILAIIAITMLAWYLLKSFMAGRYISFLTLMALFVIVDVYMPGAIGVITGKYLNYHYFKIADNTYFLALIIYSISIFLFLLGFYAKPHYCFRTSNEEYYINEKRLQIVFVVVLLVVLLNLYNEYSYCGSLDNFINYKFKRVYAVSIQYDSAIKSLVRFMSEFSFTSMLVIISIGFINNDKLRHRLFWKYTSPVISLAVALTTMYRGSIIELMCTIIASIQLSYFEKMGVMPNAIKHKMKTIGYFGVFGFLIFGAIRNSLSAQAWGNDSIPLLTSISEMLTDTLGNSLSALSRCIEYVNAGNNLFWGQSIIEMLIYPFIPRSIWVGKPALYGIVILTTAMGSPNTTMDAVTIPGELIMNFGYIGLIIIVFIGKLYKFIEKLKYHNRFKYLYVATVFSLVSTPLWMGFTGFFAKIRYFPVYILIIFFVVRKSYPKDGNGNYLDYE